MSKRLMEVGFNEFDPTDGLTVIIGESVRSTNYRSKEWQASELAEQMKLNGTFSFAHQIDGGRWFLDVYVCIDGKIVGTEDG